MEIIQTSKNISDSTPIILMLGQFDGVHLGHQAILQAAKELKSEKETLAVMSFFDPLQKKLAPDNEKKSILHQLGVERLYRVNFTEENKSNSADELVDHLSKLNVKRIVVGEEFHFGNEGEFSASELMNLAARINIPVTVVPLIKANGRKISSGKIRSLVEEGKMEAVQTMLSRPYTMTGEVVHGEALGRTLGFPTINLGGTEEYVYPKPGIYLGTVEIHNKNAGNEFWNVIISAGYRPTVNGEGYLVEAYIIDFTGDLYGKTASVSFLRYMREEINFNGLEPLVKQMELDKLEARDILGLND